jgi:L-alanine-DL-glutamate epimerase-like enolase superfamily enzyme
MVKITDLEFYRISAGTRSALGDSRMVLPTGPTASIIRVETDEGVSGVSFTAGLTGFGNPHNIEPLRELLVGENPLNVSRLWDKMVLSWRKPVYAGEMISTISGVDLALWDLVGKLSQQPLHRLWGGYRDRVPVYAAGGLYGDDEDFGRLAEEMRKYVAQGHRAVKMKVGRFGLDADLARVSAVRDAIGDGVRLMVDANGAWQRHEAVKFLEVTRDLDLFWLEEPVPVTDTQAYASLRACSAVAIAAGENASTRYGVKPLLLAGAIDVLQIDAAIGGGATEWLRTAALACAFDTPMAPHGDALIHAQLLGAIPNALMAEYDIDQHARIAAFVATSAVEDGCIAVGDEPGLGLEFDWDYIHRHRVG